MASSGGSSSSSNSIRVFVRWHDQTVFAGEEVRCTITFKNIASTQPKTSPQNFRHPDRTSRQLPPSPLQHRAKAPSSLAPPSPAVARGHRLTNSLSVPSAAATSRVRAGSVPWPPNAVGDGRPSPKGLSHARSISIVSIGSAAAAEEQPNRAASPRTVRPGRGHARASSLQIVPRSPVSGARSASFAQRPYTSQQSPLWNASYPPPDRNGFGRRPSGGFTAPNTPRIGISTTSSPRPLPDSIPEFSFPMARTSESRASTVRRDSSASLKTIDESADLPMRTRGKESVPLINEQHVSPAARILSATSIAGTPRSSAEFYTLSNNSSETLASEYVAQQPLRTHGRGPHHRSPSNLVTQNAPRAPEPLMMGYAQIQGSFTLDGSLVNLGPFEAVKRKAVVGGQGGGVIGLDTNKRDSGLLKSFGWGSFTSSIGELLGGGELSSIKDMRGIASSKSVPLLSTPQSILFVDLQLAPGESKTFDYIFALPRGLPPSHRGKAMKISYSLVIGTQRPGGAKEQQVKSVDVPFRVLGSVNSHGEILGHDLMSPYIVLRDQARVQAVEKGHQPRKPSPTKTSSSKSASDVDSFLNYVDELLDRSQQGGSSGLLSPTATPTSRRPSAICMFDEPLSPAPTGREAIDLAIMRANMTGAGQQSANRFEIARNRRRVGVVMLGRPAYRLGEVVSMAVDFSGADIPCYAVHAALETSESVDPTFALRSEASIHRVTRKVFVSASEVALFSRRWVFTPTIPVSATPEFVTSGVSLEWKIRLEFVVPAQDEKSTSARPSTYLDQDAGEEREGGDSEADELVGGQKMKPPQHEGPHPLLEEISRDDRGGIVLVAAETLACESFEVAVPLRVYGAVCMGLERLQRDEALEGLVV